MSSVVIIDYGVGNLYSVLRACDHVGLQARISHRPDAVREADGLILPGVGGMPEAMKALDERGLTTALKEAVEGGTPLFGVCLGMQLLLDRGSEFHEHRGLGIIPGSVEPMSGVGHGGEPLKVPHIGWNTSELADGHGADSLAPAILDGVPPEAHMYFVHSFYARPDDARHVIGTTRYGSATFCSILAAGRVFGCQFHPEKSGPDGLKMYANFRSILGSSFT